MDLFPCCLGSRICREQGWGWGNLDEKQRGFWDAEQCVGNRAVVQGFGASLGQLTFSFFESHLNPILNEQ